VALYEARLRFALYPTPHEAYGLCAAGLPQFKAAGLAVAFDHTAPTFYRVSRGLNKYRVVAKYKLTKVAISRKNIELWQIIN
jgi:hypothetical protein